jgi:uncharacterized protein
MSLFVDTSAFYALLDRDDAHHGESAGAWRGMMTSDQSVATTNYVIVETFALIQSRLGLKAVRSFHDDIIPVLRIEFVTLEMHRLGIAALFTAAKRGLSLVDCVSFEVMRALGMKSVFTFDNHFRERGFAVIP